jgi:xanthine dehydrogenase small subunit
MERMRNSIRVLLDGNLHEIAQPDPTRSVLAWLRDDLGRTGTKEGCAEGDCGACTVVVGELHDDGVRLRPVNSCIRFLPTLDGKALFTVESLVHPIDGPHPVQRAMVDVHASQCGFCTPGFVMSLFALYKSEADPDRPAIDRALAGNLCRCTGYRPIVEAARRMRDVAGMPATSPLQAWMRTPCGQVPADRAVVGESGLRRQLADIAPSDPVRYDAAGIRYFAPTSVDGLAACLSAHPEATLLAGGTDVGLWATKQLLKLDPLIYLGQVAELARASETPGEIVIGAAVTLADATPLLVRHFPMLAELLERFASPPIRCSATLGGNVANGSPIGDSMPALIALGATVDLRCGDRARTIALEDLYLAYRKKDLAPGEFLVAVRIPKLPAHRLMRTWKVSKRRDQDISAVCGAFVLDLRDGAIAAARIAFGGMGPVPARALRCEAALAGRPWSEATAREAARALAEDFQPIDDMRASAAYRTTVAGNLLLRLWHESRDPDYRVRADGP